ncbi:DUF1152 domain-containing protein [Acetivibrio cellulolyticus]|uniref:DUF1152 domain-containing protein n=1 Tax=Acetivibrio cellulolyticus TaxID=35830 RepID=UPI0002481B9B|nr:DUF1152 domain-containing protein [Acetivibrio cellulolyticus]
MLLPINLNKKSNILLAGAGGGYDFLCSLPIALKLIEQGHNVFIANYSFTYLNSVTNGKWISPEIMEITYKSSIEGTDYFPELYLSKWFKEIKKVDMPIYCFPRIGIKPLYKAYEFLKKFLDITDVMIVDGGVDGIFKGDEYDLGTPSMDSISIISSSLNDFEHKYYIFTAFGSEGANKEVSHAEALNRVSDLIKEDKFFGVASILKNTETGKEFVQAVEYIYKNMPSEKHSNIVSSIIKAMSGNFGDTLVNEKATSPIWVSALTNMYWFFDLDAVAKMKLFYNDVLQTETVEEVANVIELIRETKKSCIRSNIPI